MRVGVALGDGVALGWMVTVGSGVSVSVGAERAVVLEASVGTTPGAELQAKEKRMKQIIVVRHALCFVQIEICMIHLASFFCFYNLTKVIPDCQVLDSLRRQSLCAHTNNHPRMGSRIREYERIHSFIRGLFVDGFTPSLPQS